MKQNNKIQATEVVEFLNNNPGFFNDYPDLLLKLKVSHPKTGNEISLIEKQILHLRQKKELLHAENETFKVIAEQNSQIFNKIHDLTKCLISSTEQQAIDVIYQHMLQVFNVDHVNLFSWKIPNKPLTRIHQIGMGSNWIKILKSRLDNKKPMCGLLEDEWKQGLFHDNIEPINSTCIIPLGVDKNWGFLVLGSTNTKFHGEQETYFLQILAEVISAKFNHLFSIE